MKIGFADVDGHYDPYVMVYDRPSAPPITRHLQRWVNNKRFFYTVTDFADYAPAKSNLKNDGRNINRG